MKDLTKYFVNQFKEDKDWEKKQRNKHIDLTILNIVVKLKKLKNYFNLNHLDHLNMYMTLIEDVIHYIK